MKLPSTDGPNERWHAKAGRQAEPVNVAGPTSWLGLLRVAGELLARASPVLLRSTSVQRALTGAPGEAARVEALSAAVARRYGLEATVRVGERSLSVVFRRRTDGTFPRR